MRTTKIINRILINAVLLIAAFLLQTSVFPFIPLFSTAPNLLVILVFSIGFIYGSFTGMLCGLFSGFLLDMFYDVPYGFFILIFIFIGFLNGFFTNYFYDDYLTLPVLLCVFSETFYNGAVFFLRYLTSGVFNFGYSFVHVFLPELIFSVMITFLLYKVFLKANRFMDFKQDKRGQNVA